MKKLLAIAALGAVLAAPAFAQAPNAREEAARAGWSSRVHVYAPDHYARSRGNSNTNPDFQLGGDR
jgi:opacity protein-like surface antigen